MEKIKANTTWKGQKVLFYTELFGKEYYWMQDIDGTIYLARVGKDGFPDLT